MARWRSRPGSEHGARWLARDVDVLAALVAIEAVVAVVAELATELVAAPLDLDALAGRSVVLAVVADLVVAEHAPLAPLGATARARTHGSTAASGPPWASW